MAFGVILVSITTLLITQHRVRAGYERMFREQFDWQIKYFSAVQATRLESVMEDCRKLAESQRVIDAFKQPTINVAALEQFARMELGDALDAFAPESRPGDEGGPRGRRLRE